MNKQAYEYIVGIVLSKRAGLLDVATSLVAAGGTAIVKGQEKADRIQAIDEEIATNNKAIQQLQAAGSNSIAIRKYVDRNIKLQEERGRLTTGGL